MQIFFPTTENDLMGAFSEVKETLCMHNGLIEDQGNWTKHDWHVDKLYSCSNFLQASLLCAEDGFVRKIERSPKIPLARLHVPRRAYVLKVEMDEPLESAGVFWATS